MSALENVPSPGLLTIDLDALAHNFDALRRAAAPGRCGAVVKANAYGLGLAPVAATLYADGCRDFFVANLDEGLRLRALLDDARIYVLAGVEAGTASSLREASLVPVLNSLRQVDDWLDAGASASDPVVIQVDTGMTRLGMTGDEVAALAADADRVAGLAVEYLATHFACADEPDHPLNAAQRKRFDAVRELLPGAKTCVDNSASTLSDAVGRWDLSRAGIALYGGNPFLDRDSPVRPVVQLHSPILQVRDIVEAVSVGYGATHRAEPPARLATVGVGYADGYPRALGNNANVFFGGHYAPVVGRVSMDLITIDVSGIPEDLVHPGAMVELLGTNVDIDALARAAETISYELLTRLGPRWRRRYIGSHADRLAPAALQ